jgi:hypothetical protein
MTHHIHGKPSESNRKKTLQAKLFCKYSLKHRRSSQIVESTRRRPKHHRNDRIDTHTIAQMDSNTHPTFEGLLQRDKESDVSKSNDDIQSQVAPSKRPIDEDSTGAIS